MYGWCLREVDITQQYWVWAVHLKLNGSHTGWISYNLQITCLNYCCLPRKCVLTACTIEYGVCVMYVHLISGSSQGPVK